MSTIEQDGYNALGQKTFADFFDSTTGRLVEEIGYRTDGSTSVDIKHALAGSSTSSYYDPSGRLTELDNYAANGAQTGSLQYAADGTHTSVGFDGSGRVAEIDAYNASGVEIYGNSYNPISGALTKQTGFYSSGVISVLINDNADGSFNASYYTTSTRLYEYDTYNALHLQIGSLQYAMDGSYISVHFDAQGRYNEFDAYNTSKLKLYSNVYDDATARLTQQIGYRADGSTSLIINDDISGSHTADYYNTSGKLSEHDTYAAGGQQTGSVQYAGDGTYSSVGFDGTGRVIRISEYSPANVLLYANQYNGATGALVEQDGYSANGVETISIVHNADGSVVQNTFDNSGLKLTTETISASGLPISATSYASDGTYTTSQFSSGILTTLTGYSASGVASYANHYSTSTGALVEQDGYGSTGVLNYSHVIATDGTSSSEYFDASGQIVEHDYFNAAGLETASTSTASDGSYIQRMYNSGALAEQDGFDAQGRKTFVSVYSSDGSSTQTSFDTSGAVYLQNIYNTHGQIVTSTSTANGVISYVYVITPPTVGALSTTGLQMSFDDEFTALNAQPSHGSYWDTTLAGGARTYAVSGATDGEIEYYSDSSVGANPFSITNGILDIAARRAGGLPSGLSWTSGALTTYGNFTQTYGVFEMRAELPAGSGFWPAFFLLPAAGFGPPELDIMENLGGDPTTDYTSTHSLASGSKTGVTDVVNTANLSTGFHTFAVDWEPSTITWYVDGVAVSTQATPSDMHSPMYMLLNLAVGAAGSWPGAVPASVSGGDLLVDWVKVFQTSATIQSGFTLVGSPANSNLVGGAGNDVFTVGTGAEHIDGAGGSNTVNVSRNFENASVLHNLDGSWTVNSTLGADTLHNIGSIQFSDGVTTLAGNIATTANTAGAIVKIDTFDAADAGYAEDIYNGSGRVLEHDVYNTAGQKTLSTSYAADGSTSRQVFTNGVLVEQDGYTSGNVIIYKNLYGATGALAEQDGYDGSGHLNAKALYTNGVLTEQDGFSTTGVKTYENIYNSAGTLTEQDGFDASGNITEKIMHAADKSYVVYDYGTTGAVTQETDYNAAGTQLLSKMSNGSGGYTIVGAQDGVLLTGSLGPDTFYGGGASQTFSFTTGFGMDVIENFHAGAATGHDVIQINHALFANFGALIAATHDVNGSAVITFDTHDIITLAGVHTAALVAGDFGFF